jgi:hypothetical protein
MLTVAGLLLCFPALWLAVLIAGLIGQAAAEQGLRGPVWWVFSTAIVAAFVGARLLAAAGWFR